MNEHNAHISLLSKRATNLASFLFHGLGGFAFPLAFLFGSSLVMFLFAFGQADGEFYASALVVHVQRHQGVAGALDFADEFVDFGCV